MASSSWKRTIYGMFHIKHPTTIYVVGLLLLFINCMCSADSSQMSSADNRVKRSTSGHGVITVEFQRASASEYIQCNTTFQPEEVSINENEILTVNYSIICEFIRDDTNLTLDSLRLHFKIKDASVATIEGKSDFNYSLTYGDGNMPQMAVHTITVDGYFNIKGRGFGKTQVELEIITVFLFGKSPLNAEIVKYGVVVLKANTVITTIFLAMLGVMIVIYNLGFGCKIEWDLVVAIFKKPVAPAIGFCCQFLVMAPLSFGIARALNLSDEAGLGLLAIGASPGGGGSNVFSYLLDGDLELSITMSFISTLASLGMTPFWIWALGRFFTEGNPNIQIPITSVFSSLAVVIIPVVIGLLVRRFKPVVAKKIAWCLKPFTGVIGVTFIGMGVYVYYPSLARVTWEILVACIIVPVCGYIIGASVGKICKQSRRKWITISLETGFQNLALAMLILGTSLDHPESDLAGVVPICYTFLSAAVPSVLFIIRFFYLVRKGEKPWKTSDSLDLSPMHVRLENDIGSPQKRNKTELPVDNGGVTCSVASVMDRYTLRAETEITLEQNNDTLSNGHVQMESICTNPNGHISTGKAVA